MSEGSMIRLDLAKHLFRVHRADVSGGSVKATSPAIRALWYWPVVLVWVTSARTPTSRFFIRCWVSTSKVSLSTVVRRAPVTSSSRSRMLVLRLSR
jgi:hypothetical protein